MPRNCAAVIGKIVKGHVSQVEHILCFLQAIIAVSSLEIFHEPDRYPLAGGFVRFILVARAIDSP